MNSEEEKVYRLEGKTIKYGTSVFSIRRNQSSRPKKRRTKREPQQETDAARYVGTTPDIVLDPIPAVDLNETGLETKVTDPPESSIPTLPDINLKAPPVVNAHVSSVSLSVTFAFVGDSGLLIVSLYL